MIESSLPTFEAFCEHHDPSSLFADQAYIRQYESVVRLYTLIASTTYVPPNTKGTLSRPVHARWRSAGLRAIKSIAASEALASVTGRQLDVIVPLILENLWTSDEDVLDMLLQRVQVEEKVDTEKLLRRRTSVATVGTADTSEAHPAAFSGTANDADRIAEEDIGVLAMQCLKSIFVVPNRAQIHGATSALLKFIFDRVSQGENVVELGARSKHDSGWAITIYSFISRWTPVQDRYVLLVAAMDTLSRNPIKDDKMGQQMALVAIIGSLLRSDVNLIGLSVMDVLLGLVRQMRKLFQPLGGPTRSENGVEEKTEAEQDARKLLLERLEQCIGDLATHVYYADQISDMISAIIARLKPTRASSTDSTPQGEGADVTGPATSMQDLNETQSNIDAYFSYNKGRVSGLRIIKNILFVANPQLKISGNMNLSRNCVPLAVWEGTHWLLRDPDGEVRQAYIDALTTWLDRETSPADLLAKDESQGRSSNKQTREITSIVGSRRVVSSNSNRERLPRGRRSQFLPLLHLSIYDNALQFVDYEADLVMLHIVLTKFVFRFGVNAVRFGIPMIFRLQEDIQELEDPVRKVRIAALCHGYFWALTDKFDFEGSATGRAIQSEFVRRRSKGFWVDGINVPPPVLSAAGLPGQTGLQPTWDLATLQREALLPFDDRSSLVECIATGYEESTRSPPTSPVVSPGRRLTNPTLGSTSSSVPVVDHDVEFPTAFKDQMLTEWSRDGVITALAAEGKTDSLNGSKAGTSATRNRLTINTTSPNGNGHIYIYPYESPHNLRPQSARFPGDRDRYGSASKLRKTSVRSGISPSASGTAKVGVASVDQLKMVLSGNLSAQTMGLRADDDDSGDSMVSFEYAPSEVSWNPAAAATNTDAPSRSASLSRRGPLASNPPNQRNPIMYDDEVEEYVPPVPPLPSAISSKTYNHGVHGEDIAVQDHAQKTPRRKSSRGASLRSRHSQHSRPPMESFQTMGLQDLLMGIDSRSGEGSLGNVTKPPY